MRRMWRGWECAALVLVGMPVWAEDDRVVEEPPVAWIPHAVCA